MNNAELQQEATQPDNGAAVSKAELKPRRLVGQKNADRRYKEVVKKEKHRVEVVFDQRDETEAKIIYWLKQQSSEGGTVKMIIKNLILNEIGESNG
jgi:DNA-binding protein H-NS